MKILAPAKINLLLEVGTLERGFHELTSFVDIVDLYDVIEIKESLSTTVRFHPHAGIPEENTVTACIALLKSLFNVKKGVSVTIRKNIPPGSGLAGGSSDAAAVLKALAKLWNLNLSAEQLLDAAARIGKDVPLFIHGKRCIMKGFGERITPVSGSQPLVYFLAVPPYVVATGVVYSRFDALGLKGDLTGIDGKIKLLNDSIEKKDIKSAELLMKNGLQIPYLDIWKQSKEVMDLLQETSGKRIFVSGSGGTLFSVFSDRREAEAAARFLNVKGWKGYVVESVITS